MDVEIRPRYLSSESIEIDDDEIEACGGDIAKIKSLFFEALKNRNDEEPNLWEFVDIDYEINEFLNNED